MHESLHDFTSAHKCFDGTDLSVGLKSQVESHAFYPETTKVPGIPCVRG